MKHIILLLLIVFIAGYTYSQDSSKQNISQDSLLQTITTNTPPPATNINNNNWKKLDISNRANDHFMVQYGYDSWGNVPDSINTSGFSRHFNAYFMLDKPFKNNPHFSIAFGLGIGSSNIFFKNTYVDLKSQTTTLPFRNVSNADHFKKFKLTTIFVELPIEFRIVTNPVTPDKGLKFAVGLKAGALLNAHTKGKNLVNASGQSIYGSGYIMKEADKRFINSTRFAATARIGIGNFSIDGSYQLTNFLKEGVGPQIKPYSIGLTLSGL